MCVVDKINHRIACVVAATLLYSATTVSIIVTYRNQPQHGAELATLRRQEGVTVQWSSITISTSEYCLYEAVHVKCNPLPLQLERIQLESTSAYENYAIKLLRPGLLYLILTAGLIASVTSLTMYWISTLVPEVHHIRWLHVATSLVAVACYVCPATLIMIMYRHFRTVAAVSVETGSFYTRCLIAASCSAGLAIVMIFTSPCRR